MVYPRHPLLVSPLGIHGPVWTSAVIASSPHCDALNSYPFFVKPASVSTGIGISRINKVHDQEQLAHIVEEITKQYPTQTVLIERFLGGREFTVGIIGTGAASYVIGVRKLVFLKGNPQIPINPDRAYTAYDPALRDLDVYGHELKHKSSQNPQYVDIDLSDDIAHAAGEVALKAWKLLGCCDGGRVDIRHEKMGLGAVPNFIEVSTDADSLTRYLTMIIFSSGKSARRTDPKLD